MSISTSRTGELPAIRPSSWWQSTTSTLRGNTVAANLLGLLGALFAIFLLLRVSEPWDIRIPLYLIALVWTIVRPRTALYLMPIAVPWGSLDSITVGSASLNSADLLVGFLLAGWFMGLALPRTNESERARGNVPRYLIVALLALLAMMVISMTAATSISSSIKEIVKWLEVLVIVLLGARYIRTRRQIWTIITIVILAGITQAFYGYFQAFFNLGPSAFIRDASLRVYGTFGQPNPYAGYINMPLSIAIALTLLGGNWKTRILGAIATILLGYAEFLTLSRGGEIAIATAIAFILIIGSPRIRQFIGPLFIAALVAVELFIVGVLPQHLLNPVYKQLGLSGISFTAPSQADYSTAERLAHWYAGIQMFLSHPLLGVGIGNYPDVYAHYYITIFVNSLGHAHNYYINIAAEMGIFGLIVFLLFLFALFLAAGTACRAISSRYHTAKAIRQQHAIRRDIPDWSINKLLMHLSLRPISIERIEQIEPEHSARTVLEKLTSDRALAIGLLAALITVCVHNLVDDLYVHSMTNLIALLLIALIRLEGVTEEVSQNVPATTGIHGGYIDQGKHRFSR